MPELKQIEASIELGTSNTKLKEYGTRYSDGHVETFVAVPDTGMPFSIHITTKGYIAPGISFFVFMDGEYQCNRNKIGLKLPGDGVSALEYEAEFRLRQKEEKTSAGSFVAREWSFAKLNTVAADKAPSLNTAFVRNVGTIEIVAMRCRPSSEEPLQRQTASKSGKKEPAAPRAPSRASEEKRTKQPTPAPSRAPSKAPSKAPSDKAAPAEDDGPFGGLFGLFDGACDSMGLDGANDERPVGIDGRVTPQPPPGFAWDGVRGEFRPHDRLTPGLPGTFPDKAPEPSSDGLARAKAFIAKAAREAQNDQLDGPGDWRNTYGKGHQGQQDDLRGDQYFGMHGPERSHYKQHFRERGDTVSQTPRPVIGIGVMEGFVCNSRETAETIQRAETDAKPGARLCAASEDRGYYENSPSGATLLTDDLGKMRHELHDIAARHPHVDLGDAWQQWNLMDAKLRSMGPGKGPATATSKPRPLQEPQTVFHALEEALGDVQILRVKVRLVGRECGGSQVDAMLERLQQAEDHFMNDPLWNAPPPDQLRALGARREQLRQLNGVLSETMDAIMKLNSNNPVDAIVKRIDEICEEGRDVGRRYSQLKGTTSASAPPGAGRTGPSTPRHVNFQQGFDGVPATPTPGAAWNVGGGGNDWQEVGERSWKQGQDTAWVAPKHASTQEHFPGEQLQTANTPWGEPAANNWNPSKQKQNAGAGSHAGSKRSQHDGWGGGSQKAQDRGWGDNKQDGAAWAGGSQKAQDGGRGENNQGGWAGSKPKSNAGSNTGWGGGAAASEHPSRNNDGGGGNGWGGGDNGAGNWDAQSKKSEAKSNEWGNAAPSNKSASKGGGGGWGNDAPASNANGSKSGAHSSRTSSASGPKELIKPYWKDWDKPGGQASGSQAGSTRMRETARPAYAYPAAKLPAIPEGKIASATHGVQAGRGAEYNHVCRRPVYIDTMEKPYAVFSFKYRSKDKLKKITGLNVKSVDDDVKAVQRQVQKDKLMQMPNDQLIEQLMKSSIGKSGSQKAASGGGGQGWGDKAASKAASQGDAWGGGSKAKTAAGSGWNAGPAAGGDGGRSGGSIHSKSKKSAGNDWGGNQGNGGWDGQNDAGGDVPEPDIPARPATEGGGFKFDYDAYRHKDYPETPAKGEPGDNWGQELSGSVFEDPYGTRWKGDRVVGHAPWATSSVRKADPTVEEGEVGGVQW